MAIIGFHASHEQIPPSALLAHVQHAERAGFEAAMCSDHATPFSRRQGESGFALAWLGAALATTALPLGVVHAPGQRYHPAISAQGIATLGEMFPGRFWAALGSGQNINEHITGDDWPEKEHRLQRLAESIDVIRRLLAGEQVSHDGAVAVDRARVWSRPQTPPPLLGAAVSVESAAWHARWADGLITVGRDAATERDVLAAYRDAGGRGPAAVQLHLSWAPEEAEALRIAREQWATGTLGYPASSDLALPEEFERETADATDDAIRQAVLVSSDLGAHRARIEEILSLGYDAVYVHHVGQEQAAFLDAFGEHVLPALPASEGAS